MGCESKTTAKNAKQRGKVGPTGVVSPSGLRKPLKKEFPGREDVRGLVRGLVSNTREAGLGRKNRREPEARPPKISLKKEVNIPRVQIDTSDLASAAGVGKRLIMIDNTSYGPPMEHRQAGLDFTVDGETLLDAFRITSGRYWTTSNGKNIYFLANTAVNATDEELANSSRTIGAPYRIVDFDFGEGRKTNLSDLKPEEGNVRGRVEQNLDMITRRVRGSETPATSSQFATQQWILVQANSFVTARDPFSSGLNIRKPTTKAEIASKPTIPSRAGNRETMVSEPNWSAYWHGGTPQAKPPDPARIAARAERQLAESTRRVETPAEEEVPAFEPVIRQGEEFFDHSFEIGIPFGNKEIEKYGGLIKPLTAKFDPVYNFYIDKYEKVTTNGKDNEALLPNLYVIVSEFDEESNNSDFINHITLIGNVDKKIVPYRPSNKFLFGYSNIYEIKKNAGQYFDKYARAYERIYRPIQALVQKEIGEDNLERRNFTNQSLEQRRRSDEQERLSNLQLRFLNIIFPMENIDMLKKYDSKRHMFPMYYDIEFSTDKTTTIAQILKDSKLSTALQARIVKGVYFDEGFEMDSFVEVKELVTLQRSQLAGASIPKKQVSISKTVNRSWDITQWLAEFDEKDSKSGEGIDPEKRRKILSLDQIGDIGIYLGAETKEQRASLDPHMKFFRQLLKIIFIGKLRKLTKQKFRTYEEMMNGKLAYSETVMYRVEKLASSSEGEPRMPALQNFYFPNSNEIDVLKFIDTQVKYNKNYVYRIYAYQAVIGTKYEYSDLMTIGDYASFLVTQYPSIRLIEVLYFEHHSRIIDSPPVFPEIEPIPYRGISDKILFFLRANVGDYIMDPIYIEPDDEKKFNEIRKAMGLETDDPIRFKTDDHTGIFQIFRTDKRPIQYGDFTGKLIAAVETDVSKITPQSANAAAYVDKIEPNKKYYYMFRIVDVHGHISNPGPIYEIEMVDERGTIYPLVEVVDFALETPKKPSRQFKKYIMISPSIPQLLIDEEKSKIVDIESAKDVKRIFLGIAEERVWGKKFKVRITSKSTGKKVDLNLDFTVTDVRRPKEDEQ